VRGFGPWHGAWRLPRVNRIAEFLQNALILLTGNPGRSAMMGRQIKFFVIPAAHLRWRDEQAE